MIGFVACDTTTIPLFLTTSRNEMEMEILLSKRSFETLTSLVVLFTFEGENSIDQLVIVQVELFFGTRTAAFVQP